MNPGTAQQLTETFYQSYDVLGLASALLGKVLVSDIGRQRCAGILVETEAYRGADDRACFSLDSNDLVISINFSNYAQALLFFNPRRIPVCLVRECTAAKAGPGGVVPAL